MTLRASVLASAVLGCFLVACSGAPPEDGAPDYELTSTGEEQTDLGEEQTPTAEESDPILEDDRSSDGGTGSSDGTTTTPTAPTTTMTIDGTSVNIDETRIWAEVTGPGEYNLFVKVSSAGVPSGSDVLVSATKTGSGCAANSVTYRPMNDKQYNNASPSCGLVINEIPTAVGGHFRGSFRGTVTAINTSPTKTKPLELTFDVVRTK